MNEESDHLMEYLRICRGIYERKVADGTWDDCYRELRSKRLAKSHLTLDFMQQHYPDICLTEFYLYLAERPPVSVQIDHLDGGKLFLRTSV